MLSCKINRQLMLNFLHLKYRCSPSNVYGQLTIFVTYHITCVCSFALRFTLIKTLNVVLCCEEIDLVPFWNFFFKNTVLFKSFVSLHVLHSLYLNIFLTTFDVLLHVHVCNV